MDYSFAFRGFCVGVIFSATMLITTAVLAAPPCLANPDGPVVDLSVPVTELRTVTNDQALNALKQFGVKTIIRYYDFSDESLVCKTLLADESDAILAKGLSIAVVFQHNNDDPETIFDPKRGAADAERALALAAANGQPFGSTIYFGVDGVDQVINDVVYEYALAGGGPMKEARKAELHAKGDDKDIRHYERFLLYKDDVFKGPVKDLRPESMLPFVQRYFSDIARVFREAAAADPSGKTYDIGGYGSGLVCTALLAKPSHVKYCWLAQSTGWPGYDAFKAGKAWSLLQENSTVCDGWRNLRKPGPVDFDFNRVSATKPDFGQWSVKRNPVVPVGRPATCPPL